MKFEKKNKKKKKEGHVPNAVNWIYSRSIPFFLTVILRAS